MSRALTAGRPPYARIAVLLGFLVLGALAALLAAVAFLVGTERGARLVIARFTPAELSVERVDGRLLGPLRLHGIEYRSESIEATLDRLELDWAPRQIRRRTVHILAVEVDGLRLMLLDDDDGAPDPREPLGPLPDIDLPVRVVLDRLHVRDVSVTRPGEAGPFVIDEIVIAAAAEASDFAVSTIEVQSPELWLSGRAAMTARGDYPIELDIDWAAALPDAPRLAGSGTVRGTLAELSVTHELSEPARAELTAQLADLLGEPRWQVEMTVPVFLLAEVREDLPPHQVGLRLSASGGLDTAVAEASFGGQLAEVGEFVGDLRLGYAEARIAIDELAVRLPGTGAQLATNGAVSLAGDRPHAEIDGEWARLAWPLDDEPSFASPHGTFRVAGDAEDFRIVIDARAGPADSPPGRWHVSGEGTQRGFELRSLRGDFAEGAFEAAGSFAWAPGNLDAIDGRLRFSGAHDELGEVAGDLRLRYADSALRVPSLALRVPGTNARLTANGEALLGAEPVQFSLRGSWEDLAWPLTAQLAASDRADRSRPGAAARPAAGTPTAPADTGQQAATGIPAAAADTDERAVEGQFAPGQPNATDRAEAVYASPWGEFEVVGNAEAYRVDLQATVAGEAVPAGRWRVEGAGTSSTFTLERLQGETLDGHVLAHGTVGWDPELTWDVVVSADEINPAGFVEGLAGSLGAEVVTAGEQRAGEWHARVQLARLEGQLRDQPVSGSADVQLVGDALRIDTLAFRAGAAELTAAGEVNAAWDVAWQLDAPDLSLVHADVAGRLAAAGSMRGPRAGPSIRVELAGDSLALFEGTAPDGPDRLEPGADAVQADGPDDQAADERPARSRPAHSVDSVRAELDLDLSDQTASVLEATVAGIATGGFAIDEARLAGEGVRGDHGLSLVARRDEDAIEVRLQGALAGEEWSGAVERFDISGVLAGAWRTVQPAALRLSADAVALEPICWASAGLEADALNAPPDATADATATDAEVCLDGSWAQEAGGRGALRASRLPLALLAPLLPDDAALDGFVSVSAEGELDAAGTLRADARLEAGPGTLRYPISGGGIGERAFESLRARVLADTDTIDADLLLELQDGTGFRGEMTLPRSGAPGSQPVRGYLTGELHDDGLLGALVPELTETAGALRVDVVLDGTASDPRVTGTVAVEDVAMDVPLIGLQLRDVGIQATADGSATWTVSGRAASGGGQVALDGTVRVPSTGTDWQAEMSLTGENFDAYQTSLASVTVSPELTFRLSPDRTEIRGEVRVPRSTITPRDLSEAVLASPDIVIVGDTVGASAQAPLALDMYTDVRVVLGGDVHFDGFGLTGRLDGNVVVVDEPGRLTTGRGELRILDGEYTAYGQKLTIERGRIVFGDGPVEDPGLDLRVVRRTRERVGNQTREIVAGMNVRGRLSEPEVTLFSEPDLASEADVLAYLLLGRPARLSNQAESSFLDDAAQSIGVAGGDFLAGRIGRRLGLEDAYIDTGEGEGLAEAALFLGTYLSPRLYIAYGIGLFDAAVNTVRLRYTLAGGWTLRAESGQETGADLLYTIER